MFGNTRIYVNSLNLGNISIMGRTEGFCIGCPQYISEKCANPIFIATKCLI